MIKRYKDDFVACDEYHHEVSLKKMFLFKIDLATYFPKIHSSYKTLRHSFFNIILFSTNSFEICIITLFRDI